MIFSQNDIRVREVRIVNLIHELPASAAWGEYNAITTNSDDLRDAAFPGRYHRCDRSMFCTKSDAASDIDADTEVKVPGRTEQCTGNITGRIVVR